jgi:formylglycine-generating enzyme required for sulfatase activity
VVDFFRFHRPAGNKFVLTSRVVGYRDVRPSAEGLGECTLVDFEQAEIEAFVDKWTAAIERAAHGENLVAAGEAKREREELLTSVQHNPGVRALASNPLLLTILALMKRQGIALPERRVKLYQNYVETLLEHWNRARGLDRPPARDLDSDETLRVLAPLALAMHETSPGVGLVNREDVRATLEEIYRQGGVGDPQVAARRLLEDLRTHAGLLLERGPGQYGFIHLTFQEYLAGMALAQQAQEGVDEAVQALARHVGDPTWREASLLCIGYLGIVQRREKAASAVVERLLREQPGAPGEAVVLCGDAVADAWPGGITSVCRDAVRAALLATMRDDAVAAPTRAVAGATLARLGDPRFRADAWYLPNEPLLGFVEIPAGPFRMGSDKKRDPEASDAELPEHEVTLPRYFIARYPVTVAQLRAFVGDGGQVADSRALRGPDTAPTYWVRRHEALAYTEWLTAKLRAWEDAPEPLVSLLREGTDGRPWCVTLPSEAEWEKAARGSDGRKYPWGNDPPDASRANYSSTGIGKPSAVACFRRGASPYGVEDLCGNVWEWTRSVLRPYPYIPADGREDLRTSNREHRVLRGGAFHDEGRDVRAASRRTVTIDHFNGFRVVVSPFTSDL